MSRKLSCGILAVCFISLLVLSPSFSRAEEPALEKRKSSRDLPLLSSFQEILPEVQVVADQMEYERDSKKMTAKGNAVIEFQDMKILADHVEVFADTRDAHAKGHVLIFQGGLLTAEGKEVYYNFGSHKGSFPKGRHISTPWYATGDEIERVRKGVTHITNARVTTCDREDPHYEILASKAIIKAQDKIIAWNIKIAALNKKIFWWPYLVIPLVKDDIPLQVSTGYSDQDGYYIETVKGISITEKVSGKLLNDWRSKRGFGTGAILGYDFGNLARGDIIGYWTQDKDAPILAASDNPFATREERDRGRLTWRHRANLDRHSYLVLRYHRVADEFFLQDFFEKEYRSEIEQQSFITFTKNSERFGSLIHLAKQMNRHESLVERLPELRFDWKNQPFFKEGLFYQNENSFVNLSKRFSRRAYNEDVNRFDSFHQWMMPLRWKDLKFNPYVNTRGTFYTRNRRDSDAKFRYAAGYGFDMRTQFYKTYQVTSDKFGIEINNLRHVLEPSFRMESIRPSTVSDEELHHFDAIDFVDDKDDFIFGVENRFQTKRVINGKMQRVDIVSLNTFLNYALKPDEPRSSSQFKNLIQQVVLRPYQWLQYETTVKYGVETGDLNEFTQDLILRKNRLRLLFGERYIRDEISLTGTGEIDTGHLFVTEASYELNPLWTVHAHMRWDADDMELEEWQVGAIRDLHDFILGFGYNVRNSSLQSSNKEVYVHFTMKEFTALSLRSGSGRATFSEPRIGDTVDGANTYGGRGEPFDINLAAY